MSFRTEVMAPGLAALLALAASALAQPPAVEPALPPTPPAAAPPPAVTPPPPEAAAPATASADAALDGLVAEALANNPDVLALAEQVSAAEARPEQAQALPDPMLSVQYTNDSWQPTLGEREMTTLAFMGSQTLPWPGKRRLRAAIAQNEAAQAKERVERARLTVTAAVKRAFWNLALARETLGLLEEQHGIWENAEAVARSRYVVGQGAQQDVLRAQVEITRYEQQRAEQEAEVAVRGAELNRLLNRAAEAQPPATPRLLLRPRPGELPALWAEAEARSPELRSAGVARERETLAVQLARKEFRPDLTVQAAYMNRGGLDPMWQAGVSFNLPVRKAARRSAVAEAEARGRSAARQEDAVRAQLRYRTQERRAQLHAAEALSRLYAEGVVPQARLAYEAALASYETGKVPFLSVLEALSSLYADRLGELRVVAAHERIKAALEEASLEATSEIPSAGGAAMGAPVGMTSGAAMAGAASGTSAPAAPAAMGTMGR
jgi:cobalt-zinc-cadmium efflux system outer membrane protein